MKSKKLIKYVPTFMQTNFIANGACSKIINIYLHGNTEILCCKLRIISIQCVCIYIYKQCCISGYDIKFGVSYFAPIIIFFLKNLFELKFELMTFALTRVSFAIEPILITNLISLSQMIGMHARCMYFIIQSSLQRNKKKLHKI